MPFVQQTVWKSIAGAVAVAAVLFLLWYFSSIVVYVLVSAVLAVMGTPVVRRFSALHIRHRRMPRWLAALLTLLVIWAVLAALFALFVPLFFNKVHELSNVDFATVLDRAGEPVAALQARLQEMLPLSEGTLTFSDELPQVLRGLVDGESINRFFSSVVNLVLSTAIAVFSISFITFFFLKEENLFQGMVVEAFPERYHDNIVRALSSVTELLGRYFTGLLAESLMLTVTITIVMMACGMEAADASFIGLVMGVMNVVPYAGPLIGATISVFVGLVTPIEGMGVGHTAFVIAATLLCIKCFDDFVLQPALYSERVKAHPLEVFLVILIAGSLAGIVGMLLAIPSYTVLRVFAKEFFSQFRLVRKLTEKI